MIGTAIGSILVFLLLQLPKSGTLGLNWWGNTVWTESRLTRVSGDSLRPRNDSMTAFFPAADALGTPYYPTDPNIGF